MNYLLLSFLAGMFTVASPCVLPLLPVVLGGSTLNKTWRTPFTIILSLCVSITVFTLLLKVSTIFLDVDDSFWLKLSGIIISIVGLSLIFPRSYDYISQKLGFMSKSRELQEKSLQKEGILRNILLGATLGPIFSSCSPTYGIIIATVLPSSFAVGLLNIFLYVIGLGLVLGLVAIGGQKIVRKMSWATTSNSWFRKSIGILLLLVGILIATGLIRDLEIWWVNSDFNFIDFEIDQVRKIRDS